MMKIVVNGSHELSLNGKVEKVNREPGDPRRIATTRVAVNDKIIIGGEIIVVEQIEKKS